MNKCPKCGTEFDGNFCSNCGEKWEEEKNCPKCGAKLHGSVRFCNECGYSFFNDDKSNSESKKAFQKDSKEKLFCNLRLIPFFVFALFSILLFVFYSAPVAKIVLGMGLPNESLGNVYNMSSNLLSNIPEVKGAMITLIIILIISIIYSCVFGLIAFMPKLKHKGIGILGKWKQPLFNLMGYISFLFYLIYLIVGIAIISTISSVDEGMGFFVSGSCPILLIVFSLIFSLLSICSFVVRYYLAKSSPKLLENEIKQREEYLESERIKRENYYATHVEPVAPAINKDSKKYKKDYIVYKHAKRKYDKANDKPTLEVVIWLDIHKKIVFGLVFLLVVIITTTSILVSIFTNKFRLSVVEKIQLGYTHEQVEEILGAPYSATSTDNTWFYYDKSYTSILDKIQKNNDAQEKAINSGNESTLINLISTEAELQEELNKVTYSYIEISFVKEKENQFSVSSVLFEKSRCDNNINEKKEVKNVTLSSQDAVGYYVDKSSGSEQTMSISYKENSATNPYYSSYYTDNSFYKAYLTNSITDVSGSSASIKWSDKFASYNSHCEAIKIGTISSAGTWTTNYKDIESIILPDSVVKIGDEAFKDCKNLTRIVFPDNLEYIGNNAFAGCDKLQYEEENGLKYLDKYLVGVIDKSITTVVVKEGTIGIVEGIFMGCNSLVDLNIPFIGPSLKTSFEDNDCTIEYFFGGNIPSTLKNVTVSGGKISSNAFINCSSLTSVTIGSGVTNIGSSAFYGCYKLVEVYNLSSLNITIGSTDNGYVGYYANVIHTSLDDESILIKTSDGYVFINDNGEYYLISYEGTDTELTLPNNINGNSYKINYYAFYDCSSLTSVTIGSGVTSIGGYAFYDCSSLTSVTIGSGVTSIGNRAFYECSSLTSIEIPNSVTSIGEYAFSYCRSLTSVTIGSGVTNIGSSAFYGCYKLVEVYNLSSLNITKGSSDNGDVGRYAKVIHTSLEEESNLIKTNDGYLFIYDNTDYYLVGYEGTDTELTLPNNINGNSYKINNYAFSDCRSLTSVTIGSGVTSIGGYAFYECSSLTSIEIPNSVTSIGSSAFSYCRSLTSIEIPNSVTSIGEAVFRDCHSLTSITIPNSVTSIGSSAFYYCKSLTDIIIPNSVTSIGSSAFSNCSRLTSIEIPNSVTSIGSFAFSDCRSLTSIEIPNSVTSIGEYAFSDCRSLTSVTIGSGVTSIGWYAFRECESLENVYYNGTIEDLWKVFEYCDELFVACNLYILDEFGSVEYNDNKYSLVE